MKLVIAGQSHILIPIQAFRAQHGLPETFGLVFFDAKDTEGLASMQLAGESLNKLEQALLQSIPAQYDLMSLLTICDQLTATFHNELIRINDRIGLREPEVDYAVAGFGDVLRRWCYQTIQHQISRATHADFKPIYAQWLADSVRIATHIFYYDHKGQSWQIQVVNHAYGRVGLKINTGLSVQYVLDTVHACPAEGYMFRLMQAITAQLAKHSAQSSA